MRNLRLILLVSSGMIVFCCSTVSSIRRPNKFNPKSIESLTERYALPTNIQPIGSKLPFTFGYRFTDDYGTTQSREEKTDPHNGSKSGSYSFMDAAGLYRRVDYIADHRGFRATVTTNEPGTMNADPAHVRMRAENDKRVFYRQPIRATPQLEYSSNIFSRYNFSKDSSRGKGSLISPASGLGSSGQNSPYSKSVIFDSERLELGQPKEPNFLHTINSYKGSPLPPRIPSLLIRELDAPNPVSFSKAKRLNVDHFFNNPGINPEYVFDDKTSDIGYHRPTPTRYPRRHRDSRARAKRRRPALKIHIPQGYEDHHDLPLYRDK